MPLRFSQFRGQPQHQPASVSTSGRAPGRICVSNHHVCLWTSSGQPSRSYKTDHPSIYIATFIQVKSPHSPRSMSWYRPRRWSRSIQTRNSSPFRRHLISMLFDQNKLEIELNPGDLSLYWGELPHADPCAEVPGEHR